MKKYIMFLFCLTALFSSCDNEESYQPTEEKEAVEINLLIANSEAYQKFVAAMPDGGWKGEALEKEIAKAVQNFSTEVELSLSKRYVPQINTGSMSELFELNPEIVAKQGPCTEEYALTISNLEADLGGCMLTTVDVWGCSVNHIVNVTKAKNQYHHCLQQTYPEAETVDP